MGNSHIFALLAILALPVAVAAQDIDGAIEHGLTERYPGSDIVWQQIENHLPFRIPTGPVTGYRHIDNWVDTEGRVTRTFYRYAGRDRGFSEIYKNYIDAFTAAGFEVLAQGISSDRKGVEPGSGKWLEVYFRESPWSKSGEVNTFKAGTSSSGGSGAFVARKERAAGIVHVVVSVEQHSADYVGTLIDIVEQQAVQTGLIAVDAEAIGRDLAEKGRVVLDGIYFGFDSAEIEPRSKPAMDAVAEHFAAHPDSRFHIVGHTDAKGTFEYNTSLSRARAAAVVEKLSTEYGIVAERMQAHGIGPLVPVFTNAEDAGRDRNRRVELVEWLFD